MGFKKDYSSERYPFRAILSFGPLLDHIEKLAVCRDGQLSCINPAFVKSVRGDRQLNRPIKDPAVLEKYSRIVKSMMHVIIPPLAWENEIVAAVVPFSIQPVHVSQAFRELFLDESGRMKGKIVLEDFSLDKGRVIRAYIFILRRFYGLDLKLDYPVVHVVADPHTGLDRFFQFQLDFRFVDVRALKKPPVLDRRTLEHMVDHITEPEVLREILDPGNFELQGFTVIRAVDITESEVISALQRDLIDQQSLTSKKGFSKIQRRLRTLFRRPDLIAGVAALHDDQVMLLNSGCEMVRNCIFADSHHVSREIFRNSTHARAINSGRIMRVADIEQEPWRRRYGREIMPGQIRSCLVAPLFYQGRCIGTLDVGSPVVGDLTPLDELIAAQLQPIFAIAIKKALDGLEHQVQEIIKQRCTAIHPTVEWAFRRAALKYLDSLRQGRKAVMEPIIFHDVYSFYGISDIRGSSQARNWAISQDLGTHLDLARGVIRAALEAGAMPTLEELDLELENMRRRIAKRLGTGDEHMVAGFLKRKVEPVFDQLFKLGSAGVRAAIRRYNNGLDPATHTVYDRRRDFETSVAMLNERLTAYLDRQEAVLQSVYPHYFERHRTDGVDYLVYAGRSLLEKGGFNRRHMDQFRIWQLKVACGMAWHTEQLKAELPVTLDTTHLVLVQDNPLSIRFRYDEKRFDVDRYYDVRQEIIKSRLDKATVRGNSQRLTQPGTVAVVYSQPAEARAVASHLDFLAHAGFLERPYEDLELENLQGIQGLRALRAKVRLDSDTLASHCLGR